MSANWNELASELLDFVQMFLFVLVCFLCIHFPLNFSSCGSTLCTVFYSVFLFKQFLLILSIEHSFRFKFWLKTERSFFFKIKIFFSRQKKFKWSQWNQRCSPPTKRAAQMMLSVHLWNSILPVNAGPLFSFLLFCFRKSRLFNQKNKRGNIKEKKRASVNV